MISATTPDLGSVCDRVIDHFSKRSRPNRCWRNARSA